jgi:hypothetical protein
MPFPVTPILDDFNRADVGPQPSASWSAANGTTGLKVVSNACVAAAAGRQGSRWNVEMFGPDMEAYVTLVTLPAAGDQIELHFRDDGAGSPSGYQVVFAAPNTINVYRQDAGVLTQIQFTDTSQEWADGDSLGVSMIGATITVYRKPALADWELFKLVIDATYTAAGYTNLFVENTSAVVDNFGGGTIPSDSMGIIRALHR